MPEVLEPVEIVETPSAPPPKRKLVTTGVDVFDESKPMWRLLLVFLVPVMLSTVLQSASQTMAGIWIGRLISTQALGALSAVYPIVVLFISAIMGVSSGGAVLIGQAFGSGDREKVEKVAGTVLAATLYGSIIVAVAGTLGSSAMLKLLATPPDIIGQADAYVKVIFLTMPLLAVYGVYTTMLGGTGDAKSPLYALIVSSVLTIAVTPLFVLGWLGLPKLGVASVGIASAVANAAAFAWLLMHLQRRNHALKLDRAMLAHLRIDWAILWSVIRIGVPAAVQGVMLSLAEIAILSFVNRFGSSATAAYGAITQVASYASFPVIAIGIATSVFGSQYIGARRPEKLGSVVRSAVALNYAVSIPVIVLCYAFAWTLLGAFITDPPALRMAHELLMIILWSVAILGNGAVLTGMMRASGVVLWPTLISIFSLWGVEVPAAYLLMQRIGLDGVWMGGPIGFCAALLLQFCYYELVWKRKSHERLV